MMKTLLTFLICAFTVSSSVNAQSLLKEVSLIEQVQNSNQIIEGRVVSKTSYWNESNTNIYTVNTVEVYKVFKGLATETVEIITPGGTVGLNAEIVTPSLNLNNNDLGLFMLSNTDVLLTGRNLTNPYKPYSSVQGFYQYDMLENKAASYFKVKNGITQNFYTEITGLLGRSYTDITSFSVDDLVAENIANRNAQPIFSMTPLNITAGTQSVLTINGVNFGSSQGQVLFLDSNSGGSQLTSALSSQIVLWTNTQIQVEVPSRAGSGPVRVVSTSNNTSISPQSLTIPYSQINATSSAVTGVNTDYQTHHTAQNGNGGMTWQMETSFNNNTAVKDSFLRAFNNWVCQTSINWVNGPATSLDVIALDGTNIIRFDNGSELPNGVLGRNISYFAGCSQGGQVNFFIDELDIVFNDTTNWQFGPANPSAGQFDFETVAVHELGHAHQLAHVIDTSAIMHFATSGGANRVLTQNDIDGASDVQSRSNTLAVCGTSTMIDASCPLSVDNFDLTNTISIFPIPAKNQLFVEATSTVGLNGISIFDINGRSVLQKTFSNSANLQNINLNNIASGVYLLKVNTNRGELTKRIIVE